jgi:hypothetical protein
MLELKRDQCNIGLFEHEHAFAFTSVKRIDKHSASTAELGLPPTRTRSAGEPAFVSAGDVQSACVGVSRRTGAAFLADIFACLPCTWSTTTFCSLMADVHMRRIAKLPYVSSIADPVLDRGVSGYHL